MTVPAMRSHRGFLARYPGLERAAGRRRDPLPVGGRRVPPDVAASVLACVAALYSVDAALLVGTSKRADLVEARGIVIQLLYERGYGESAIGRAICRDHSTVVHALHRLESRLTHEEWDALQMSRRDLRVRLAAAQQQKVRCQ